jgi:hypothetical protein
VTDVSSAFYYPVNSLGFGPPKSKEPLSDPVSVVREMDIPTRGAAAFPCFAMF